MGHPDLVGGRTQGIIRQSAAVYHLCCPVERFGFRLRNASGAAVVLCAAAAGECKQGKCGEGLSHPNAIALRHDLQSAYTKVH